MRIAATIVIMLLVGIAFAANAGDAALDEQRLLWSGVLNSDLFKPDPGQSLIPASQFMECALDSQILLDPQASPAIKEVILDVYAYFPYPETYRRWSTVAAIHDICLRILESESSPRVRMKAYRCAMMAENPYCWVFVFDFSVSPELQKRIDAETDKDVQKLIADFIASIPAGDTRENFKRWPELQMGIPEGGNSNYALKKKLIEDWIAKFPAPAPVVFDKSAYETLVKRLVKENEGIWDEQKTEPSMKALVGGTQFQKAIALNGAHESRADSKKWSPDCLAALSKIISESEPSLENRRIAIACLSYSRSGDVLALMPNEKSRGVRADAIQSLWIAALENSDEELYEKVMKAWENERDPWVKFVTLQSIGYKAFSFNPESAHLTPDQIKTRELHWRQFLDGILDQQKKSENKQLQSYAKKIHPDK